MGLKPAVACGHAVTRDAAVAVLEAGGSAVDAAMGAAFAAMVAEPVLAGLLGGGFLMIREAEGRCHLLDAFVETPLAKRPEHELDFHGIDADFGTTMQGFMIGAGAIATPGLVPGLAEAHARFGRVPLSEIVAPAVRAAREGVAVSPFQAQLAEIVAPILTATPAATALSCDGEGKLLRAGTRLRNADLADVLEVMGAEGPRFVTEGEVAAALLELCRAGGHLTRDDLRRYRPEWRVPLLATRETRAGKARVWLNPEPSLGGPVIARILGAAPHAPRPETLAGIFEGAQETSGDAPENPPANPPARRGTTHVSVIDAQGMAAALTLSNGEGCGHILPGTGIMPNNMLGETALVPDGWHTWAPGIRLASMMAPAAIDWPDGRAVLLGSGGSNRIATAISQVVLNLTDRAMPLADAIEAPRLHWEPETGEVDIEDLFAPKDREALLAAHPEARLWADRSMFFGGVHAVMREARGGTLAAGDPRRDGAVA